MVKNLKQSKKSKKITGEIPLEALEEEPIIIMVTETWTIIISINLEVKITTIKLSLLLY